jgi:hypothetical protein
MKKLLLLAFMLSLCSFVEGQAQSQTPLRKRPKFSSHSKRTQFAQPPHFWLKAMEGDSSLQDERRRSSLPPHLQNMDELPPHLAAERRWLLQSETERTGLEPNDPLDRLYPPHKRSLAQMQNPLKNSALNHSAQSSQSGTTQILSSGGVQEAWVVRYAGPGHAYDIAVAMASASFRVKKNDTSQGADK